MATPTAWLLNLDADMELSSPLHYRVDAAREERMRSLHGRMAMLMRSGDVVIDPAQDTRALTGFRVLAFCPTPSALRRLSALALSVPAAPALSVLQTANSRAFCAALGQTLPHTHYIESVEALLAVLQSPGPYREFILKRPFGFAGRERRKAHIEGLDASTQGFAERTFRAGQGLQVEPWLQRGRDYAMHGYLTPTGRSFRGPLMRQQCDAMGRWEYSGYAESGELDAAFLGLLEREFDATASALGHLGYFGPFGIDAFEYLDAHGQRAFQPRSEINARFSMGYPRPLLEQALAHEESGPI